MEFAAEESGQLVLVCKIPSVYHSKDLRRFFSTFVENGRFACFHYRHRPEKTTDDANAGVSTSKLVGRCCLVKLSGGTKDRSDFIHTYNGKSWTNEKGDALPGRCRIFPSRLAADEPLPIELKPPIAMMPQGNVGTPTRFFLDAIKACRLPSSVIAKLGLVFPKRNGRRIYSNVPPPNFSGANDEEIIDDDDVKNAADDDEEEESEDEQAEEWDRHEAQYDDVTDQERTKERLYEEDMEVVWEKGGPGLVFYTDAFYWDQQETDTDAKWADDWDVDTNVYVDPTDADKDARDSVAIRRETMLRSGHLEESVFKKKQAEPSSYAGKKRRLESSDEHVHEQSCSKRHFEMFGRKIMEKQGWKTGTGLGATRIGKVNSVHDELKEISRHGFDKRGFGYFGEKIDRNSFKIRPVSSKRLITTVYDDPNATDPPEVLLRRHELSWNKHR